MTTFQAAQKLAKDLTRRYGGKEFGVVADAWAAAMCRELGLPPDCAAVNIEDFGEITTLWLQNSMQGPFKETMQPYPGVMIEPQSDWVFCLSPT